MYLFVLLLYASVFAASHAVHPGCECLVYSATYGKEKGVFSSPDYPKSYQPNVDCLLYNFVAGPDEIIEIAFNDFNIRKTGANCIQGDFMKLFLHLEKSEVNEYTPWSGLLCGTYAEVPHVLYSSGPALILEFHSGHPAGNSSGFTGTFRFIDKRLFQTDGQKLPGTMCDHQFISGDYSPTKGKFYSPRYPSSYPKNIKCSYRFRARPKERIRILFEEVTLQKGDLSCLNRADLIRIHDGRGSQAPVIKVICNEVQQIEVLSTASDLFIEFVANSEWPGQGFRALFQYQPILEDNMIETADRPKNSQSRLLLGPSASATTSSCDGVFSSDTAKNGTISSPSYPSAYPPRSSCRYDFQGKGKERVQVVFTDFNLYHPTDDSKECDSIDSLIAYVHIDGRMEKIDSFCGSTLPKPLMSNGPRLMLEFKGIHSSRYSRGFKATYSFLENFGVTSGQQLSEFPCAFVYNSSVARSGTFTSPNFPGFYPRDTECHYFFHGQPNEKVRLHFSYFDVEGVLPCEAISASDYVEFSNFMIRDRIYSRHCGQLKEFDVQSDRKFFRVTFRSNDRLDGTGFKASFRFLDETEANTVKPYQAASPACSLQAAWILMAILLALVNSLQN